MTGINVFHCSCFLLTTKQWNISFIINYNVKFKIKGKIITQKHEDQ